MDTTEAEVRPTPGEADRDWRADNAGRLMFAATDLFVRHKLRVLQAAGVVAVSEATVTLMLNLDREGTRLTTLAQRAGQTKQSMIELVDRAEAAGLVERRADPHDLRAKLVRFTPEGAAVLGRLEDGIRDAERRFANVVGEAFLRELKARLGSYVGVPEEADGWRSRNAGRLLSLAARRFSRDLLRFVHERGYREVTQVLLALFRNLDLAGTRLTDLAARARMTKQSMRELVDRAEALGLVERAPDLIDGRAKRVSFTPSGLDLLHEVRRAVALAEERLDQVVGGPFALALRRRLAEYLIAEDFEPVR